MRRTWGANEERLVADMRTRALPERGFVERNALDLVQRKARQAGIMATICNQTFRATGIAAYKENGGNLEYAQAIAAHESLRNNKLYDRKADHIALDEMERIVI